MKNNFFEGIGAFVVAVVLIILGGAIMAIPVMMIWNSVIPDMFGLGTITYPDAWGLYVLCGLLFKGNCSSSSSKD